MTNPALSLDGIRVIDLSRVIAGPWCGALLADLGADVIKVEDTGPGDESRTWPPHKDGEAAAYLRLQPQQARHRAGSQAAGGGGGGQAARRRTRTWSSRTSAPGPWSRSVSATTCWPQINPRLIYCSVSAFGRTGPRKDSPGYEALMQAFSGIMSITGEPGGQPVRAGVSFLDLTTGILCALGVVQRDHPAREDRPRPAGGRLAPRDRGEPARLPRRGLPAHRRPAARARLGAPLALALPQLQVRRRAVDLHRRRQRPASGRSSRRRWA